MLAVVLAAVTALYTNTETVEDVAEHDGAIWVTTTGGLERYDATSLERLDVQPATEHPAATLSVAPRYQGARETARVTTSAGVLVGTAGQGVWLDGDHPRRLTPTGQICGNHVVAITTWKKALWVATFDAGVCWLDGDRWVTPATPFRMGNDLAATRKGLAVAASEGLFVTTDGETFTRWAHVDDEGFNDLAVAGDVLYATTPGSLWRLPLRKKAGRWHSWWRPGGSRAVQAVAADGDEVWLTSEDEGALRRVSAKRYELHDRAAGLPSSWAIDVALVGGAVWVATLRDGVVRRGADGAWTAVEGLEDAWMLFVGPDGAGDGVWAGAQGGLYHVDAAGEVDAWGGSLPDPNVHAVLPDGDALWIGTEGGLVRAPAAD